MSEAIRKYVSFPELLGTAALTKDEMALLDEIQEMANRVGELVDRLNEPPWDQRWLFIGKTNLQQGFMALMRSVAQPTTF